MMILSIVATVVLLGALFYHRVSLLLSSVILLAWTAALGAAGVWNIWLLLRQDHQPEHRAVLGDHHCAAAAGDHTVAV